MASDLTAAFVSSKGTSLTFGELNAKETVTCPLAWQPATTPNPRAAATSGRPPATLPVDGPVNQNMVLVLVGLPA